MSTITSEAELFGCFREIDRDQVELSPELAFPLALDDGGVKLMSVCSDERHRIGLYLCSDLGCVSRARELPSPDDLPERLPSGERARRTLRRIADFASRRPFEFSRAMIFCARSCIGCE